jgi:hypothetical protein
VLASGAARPDGDEGGRDKEERGSDDGALEPARECVSEWLPLCQKVVGVRGGDGAEDRQPQRATDLLGGVDQSSR